MSPRRRAPVCTLALAGALALVPTGVDAQLNPEREVVDRVVAVVGDSVVLLSQVQEEIETFRFQNPGFTMPTDPAGEQALYREVVDAWVNRLMILQAAQRDTLINVDEGRVNEIVTQELEQRARSMGGQQQLQEALLAEGITLGEYREIFRSQVRQSQIQQMYMQRRLQGAPPVEVSEQELRTAFQEARNQLQQRPKQITFRQVVVRPTPTDSAKAATRALADSLLRELRAGADFTELAAEYSDDVVSGQNGGDLGWFRRGDMVRDFENAAFALAEGQIGGPVETEFGYHIIQIQRIRLSERNGRHILLIPEVTPDDVQRARDTAQALAQRARDGASMRELHTEYSDPEAPDSMTVTVEQLTELPPGYDRLRLAPEGEVVGPIEYSGGRNETRLAVVKVTRVREAGAYTFEDVRPQLAQQLQRQKQQERILSELRERTYIEIRD